MAQQRPGFDMSRMSTASKILLGGSAIYLINAFLPYWNRACSEAFGDFPGICFGTGLWHNWGILAGLLAILILVMEVLLVANVNVAMGTPSQRLQIEAGLAGGVLLFTLLRILFNLTAISWGAWLGLILALIIAYGGYMRWSEAKVTTPPPVSPGGFTA